MKALDAAKSYLIDSYFNENNSEGMVTKKFKQRKHKNVCTTECKRCKDLEYRIFHTGTEPPDKLHPNCDCFSAWVPLKFVGTVSSRGIEGPDYHLKYFGKLPDYYITKAEAMALGWKPGKNTMGGVLPGKMIGGDRYNNKKYKLPIISGRLWQECDVDYSKGGRNSLRLFYSNDGLMFYSTDHGEKIFYYVE